MEEQAHRQTSRWLQENQQQSRQADIGTYRQEMERRTDMQTGRQADLSCKVVDKQAGKMSVSLLIKKNVMAPVNFACL